MHRAMNARRASRRDAFLSLLATRRVLMGILNVTPDSFSDGGQFATTETALTQARRLVEDGADIIDIGGESTRPGHQPIPADEEWRRLSAVLPALADLPLPVSVDTQKADLAEKACDAGAVVVNDIWGLQGDPRMADVVADHEAAVIVMHNRQTRDPMIDIAADMGRFFERSLKIAGAAGIPEARVILDPGIGFGKTKDQNFQALAAVPALRRFGRPILIGVSRKSMFGTLLGTPSDERLVPTLAANIAMAAQGANLFRVHDVREHRMALAVLDAIGL